MTLYDTMFEIAIEVYRDTLKEEQRIAMEEDTSTSAQTPNPETPAKRELGDRLGDGVEKVMILLEQTIRDLKDFLSRLLDSVVFKMKSVWESNEKFKTELLRAKQMHQPVDQIVVKCYRYDMNFLFQQKQQVDNIFKGIINKIGMDTEFLNNTTSDIDSYIFGKLKLDSVSDVSDMTTYYKYIKDRFRGEKAERTLRSDRDLAHFEKYVLNTKLVESQLNQDFNQIKNQVDSIKNRLKILRKTDSENASTYKKQIKSLAYIIKMQGQIATYYSILINEMVIASRAILSRFYQM